MSQGKFSTVKDFTQAAKAIKEAILSAQYEAFRGVNNIQLMLYYAIGRFISHNTRERKWGIGAITAISKLLKEDMPGLRGYSEANLKKMRIFYEEWKELDSNSFVQTNEMKTAHNSFIQTNEMGIESHSILLKDENIDDGKSPVQMDDLRDMKSMTVQTGEI